MAIIYSYPIVDPSANDLVLGSDVDSAGKPTKNFTVQSIIDLVTVTGNDLQAVLNNGNIATGKDINITSNNYRGGGFITTGNVTISGTTGTGFTSITSTAFTGTLSTIDQPNVTSLGTLTSLKVGNATPAITSIVTSFTAPGDDVKLATTKAIVDYIGTNPPGAESLAATLLVGNTTGATKIEVDNTGSGIDFIDDAKARFGTGNDLEIYHDASDSYIIEKNNPLYIQGGNVSIRNVAGEAGITFTSGAAVTLLYNNSQKFATTNTGVSVTGNTVATGSGTFVNLINTGTYSDSSGDVGNAGQILSSTGSGTNWITDPNPTPYNWIIEADSGTGSPYTVAQGDTIDFVGVGNIDTAWDNASKELRISLGGTSISGTGADTQVVYWTGAQTVAGDAGMLYNATSNNLTVTGTVQAGTLSDGTFSGTAGTYTGGVSITSTAFVGALTGNATTATQLASSGAIALTGDTTSTGGPYTYTSGGALSIATTIADTTVTGKVLTNLPTPASSAITASDTILAAMAKLQGQITGIPQGLVYKGTWNAATNTPTLSSGTGTTGEFYIVSVAGNTNLDGITDWQVGDWAIFVEVGATDTWQKIDNSQSITGSGATNKITKWTAPSVLGTGLIEDDGTDVTIGNNGNLIVEGNTTLGNADSDTTTVKGPARFEETLRADVGISLGNNNYGSAGQVLTSGGGSGNANTWTTPTTGTVTSVATNNGLTGGTITSTGTLGILTVGASNAIEFLSSATPASGDFVWFSDINDSNTLRKCTVADLQGPIGGPFLPLAGGTMVGNILRGDNISDYYGAGNDLQIRHTGSASFISNFNTNLIIDQEADDADIIFRCDDGSGGVTAYITLDGSDPKTIFSKPTRHIDSIQAYFGSGDDMFIRHTGSEGNIKNSVGNLYISQDANDADIIFESDNGSGGVTEYFKLDGSFEKTVFSKDIFLNDSVKALFGNSSDLQIYHDSGNSYILNSTGSLIIGQTAGAIALRPVTGENGILIVENAAVTLYYDNSAKLATTSGGVSVTGDADVSGEVQVGGQGSNFSENNLRFKSAGAAYIDHNTVGQSFIFRVSGSSSLDTTALTIKSNGSLQANDYGSGNNTGTPTYNLQVDSSGNIIETSSSNPHGGGMYSFSDTVNASANEDIFSIACTHGAQTFTAYFTCNTTGVSVAKTYTVAHSYGTTVTYNKLVDTGPYGGTATDDFTVTFTGANDTITCNIANPSSTNLDIVTTIMLGGSPTTLTVTAL